MLGKCIDYVRKNVPLVHNITNYVTVNDVANIKVTIENVSETDARAYIAKVKESGKYEHVTENEAEGVIAFAGDNEPENLDDKYSGAVYPMCTIMFIEGILRIEFNVAKLGLV